MITFGKFLCIFSSTLLILFSTELKAQSSDPVTYQVFYDALSPFGTWLHDNTNGYIWQPKVGKDFRPYYSSGSWVMTEYGSTWISTYAWGWAPFHYGRWVNDALYGWVWIPGMDWGPSWVVWRANGDMYGWTPLTPGFTISQSFGPSYLVPADWWVFVPSKKLLSPTFQQVSKSGALYNSTALKATHVINNVYTLNNKNYISGPRALEYSKATGEHITVYSLKDIAKPAKSTTVKEEITLYRPDIKKWDGGTEPKPAKSIHAEHDIGKTAAIGGKETAQKKPSGKKKSAAHTTGAKTSPKK